MKAALFRVYAILLYAYPREFRARFGREMRQAFRERWRTVSAAGQLRQQAAFLLATAKDLILSSSNERMASMKSTILSGRLWTAARGLGIAALTILVGMLAATPFLQAFVIPTMSMEGSIEQGDHILVNKMVHADQLKRDDLVTFRYPEDREQTFIKRVIGLPGDHIRLIDKQVIRNGRRLVEPYVSHQTSYVDAYRDNFPAGPPAHVPQSGLDMLAHNVVGGEIIVPAGALFVLGDNRDISLDSRYWGFVPRADVVGRPLLVYWSYDARHSETRWNRTLHMLTTAPPAEVEP